MPVHEQRRCGSAALPARASSQHTESWKFGSIPSRYQHAAVLPRRHPLGEGERKQQQPPPHPGAAQHTQKGSVRRSPVPTSICLAPVSQPAGNPSWGQEG